MPRHRIYRSNAEKQAAYRQRKRKRQPVYHWHKSDEWETPPELFAEMDAQFHFTLDVAAIPDNAKCDRFFTPARMALKSHGREVCWMNPPYGAGLRQWARKALHSARTGATVVCLLPAHRYVLVARVCLAVCGDSLSAGSAEIQRYRELGHVSLRSL